jgi:hypothetical protein
MALRYNVISSVVLNLQNGGFIMKKVLLFIIAMTVCLSVLFGCATDVDVQKKSCRVVCLQEDGIIVDIEYVGYVYVKNVNTDLEISTLNTVVMVFSESDLNPASGTFLNFDGRELNYSYILENPKSIRLADPDSGEPTFG